MKNINNSCGFMNSIMNQPETNEMSENEKPTILKKNFLLFQSPQVPASNFLLKNSCPSQIHRFSLVVEKKTSTPPPESGNLC